MESLQSYIVDDTDKLPVHLKHRSPSFSLTNVSAVFKRPLEEIVDPDGRVKYSGVIEFQGSIAPGQLTDYCDPDELYNAALRTTHRFRSVYDPEIQRGVKETKSAGPKESLREAQVESMMEDIHNDRFECPQLTWNLRGGEVVWVYFTKTKTLTVYQGVATRPDTNHRHHAIIRFHKKYLSWVEQTGSTDMPGYNPARQYGLVLYTDDFQGEAHRFYVYNFKGWRVSTSTAHYIESKTHVPAIHAKVAREAMERSGILGLKNVEIISAQLSRNSAKMITFGTLTEALKTAFPAITESDLPETLDYIVQFLDALHNARPAEIALLSVAQRQTVRDASVADQAVLWHGYFRLASWLQKNAAESWREHLALLAKPVTYERDGKSFTGDLFARDNPVWVDMAIMAPGKRGLRVLNNRQAREASFDILKAVVSGKGLNSLATNQPPSGAAVAA
jgi:hypothetical protein